VFHKKEIAGQRYLPTRRKRKENEAIGRQRAGKNQRKQKKESSREHLSGWKKKAKKGKKSKRRNKKAACQC
jgi:chromatin remodeling complex protein RSC6